MFYNNHIQPNQKVADIDANQLIGKFPGKIEEVYQ